MLCLDSTSEARRVAATLAFSSTALCFLTTDLKFPRRSMRWRVLRTCRRCLRKMRRWDARQSSAGKVTTPQPRMEGAGALGPTPLDSTTAQPMEEWPTSKAREQHSFSDFMAKHFGLDVVRSQDKTHVGIKTKLVAQTVPLRTTRGRQSQKRFLKRPAAGMRRVFLLAGGVGERGTGVGGEALGVETGTG